MTSPRTVAPERTPADQAGWDDERLHLMGLFIGAHARLTRALGAELEEQAGLPLTWFDVLVCLRRAPEGRLTMTELASQVLLTSGGGTRLVDRIAEAGYVERQQCPSDRRSVHVVLTEAGREKLDGSLPGHLAGLDEHLFGPLSIEERNELAHALTKLVGDAPTCGGAA